MYIVNLRIGKNLLMYLLKIANRIDSFSFNQRESEEHFLSVLLTKIEEEEDCKRIGRGGKIWQSKQNGYGLLCHKTETLF